MAIEVVEEGEEERRLDGGQQLVVERVAGLVGEQHEAVGGEDDELDELQLRDVALPPEMAPDGGAEGGERVVRVHDDVHEAVEQREQPDPRHRRAHPRAKPPEHRHRHVVVEVESWTEKLKRF